MLVVIGLMQLVVGSRNIGRRGIQKGDGGWSVRTNVSLPGTASGPTTIAGAG